MLDKQAKVFKKTDHDSWKFHGAGSHFWILLADSILFRG